MKPKIKILENGLKVVFVQNPYLNKSNITLLIKGGPAYENKKIKAGVSHLCEHSILLGTKNFSSKTLLDFQFSKNIISYYLFTNQDNISIQFNFHKSILKTPLKLLREIVFQPIFPEENILLEKQRIKEEKQFEINNKYQIFQNKVNDYLFANSNINKDYFGDVDNIERKDLVGFWKNFFVPNNMIITYVGPKKYNEVVKFINKFFGDIQKGTKAPLLVIKNNYKKKIGQIKCFNIAGGFKYLTFVLPIKYTKKNNPDLIFLFYKLLETKIKDELINKKQISYDIDTYLNEEYKMAIIEISSSFSEKPKTVIKIIKDMLKKFSVNDNELRLIKKKVFYQMNYIQDDPQKYGEYLAQNCFDLPEITLDNEKKSLKKVTVSEINNFARGVLKDDKYSIFFSNT